MKESLTQMTTLFAEQKHVLDNADQFNSFEDLLEALRRDITIETKNLLREIEDIIRGKTDKYIGKWGNTSKVGILINAYDGQ